MTVENQASEDFLVAKVTFEPTVTSVFSPTTRQEDEGKDKTLNNQNNQTQQSATSTPMSGASHSSTTSEQVESIENSSDELFDAHNKGAKKSKKKKRGKKGKEDKNKSKEEIEAEKEAQRLMSSRRNFTLNSPLYKFSEHLAMYHNLYQESYPQLMTAKMKFFISTEHNGVGAMDMLFQDFCDFMKMDKVKILPIEGGERVFCWLGKRKANGIIRVLRPEHHYVNKLPLDIVLKDKQSLSQLLKNNSFNRFACYPPHKCPHKGNEKLKFQLICEHNYARHTMLPCEEEDCHFNVISSAIQNFDIEDVEAQDPCPCFKTKYFVPETRIFSSLHEQQVFLEEIRKFAPLAQWVVKPSYERGGKGIRILTSADQVRDFFKLGDRNRKIPWGNNYLIQRYIQKPLLTNKGQKFDIRSFLCVIATSYRRVLGFYHPGYIRKVPVPYEEIEYDGQYKGRHHLANTRVWNKYKPTKPEDDPNNSQSKGNSKGKGSEPVPLMEQLYYDECEEYNLSITKGSLSEGTVKLPEIPGTLKMTDPAVKENPFILSLHLMINKICEGLYEIVKENANCHQTFSLDMVVDYTGKPWLLEVNPSIVTESINWESKTLRFIIPAIFIETLALVTETTKKAMNFVPMRTPADFAEKPNDIVFRENFLLWYLTPEYKLNIMEMKLKKYFIESEYKNQLVMKGIQIKPIDFFPKINNPKKYYADLKKAEEEKQKAVAAALEAEKSNSSKRTSRRSRRKRKKSNVKLVPDKKPDNVQVRPRVPTPVQNIPVIFEDVWMSYRFKHRNPNFVRRIAMVRGMERRTYHRRLHNVKVRKEAYNEMIRLSKISHRERILT